MFKHQNEVWKLGCRTLWGTLLAAAVVAAPGVAQAVERRGRQPELTMDRRVACQRAIEQVYWQHRIWPAENARAKPPFDAVFSSEQLAARVRDGLRKSAALEVYWDRPITAAQIDAEVRRMARGTRNPDRLRELWAALDDDPLLVAECLARPLLADRSIRQLYNFDEPTHGPLRGGAVDVLEGSGTVERQPDRVRQAIAPSDKVPFDQWWSETKSTLPALMDVVAGGSVLPEIAEEGCTDDAWNPMRQVPKERDGHIAVWTGSEMIVWGGAFCEIDSVVPGGRYDPATDSWIAINVNNPPTNRHGATGVWTGTEMIVWGGWACSLPGNVKNTGGRYNPTTDEWTPTSTFGNVPSPRVDHTAVWTGTEMLVWGGTSSFGWCPGAGEACTDTGAGYDPITDSWTPIALGGAPVGRRAHTAVWTGSEMIVWSGERSLQTLNDGARYNPISDTWNSTSTTNAPVGRLRHTTVWTGSEMVVWGGCESRGCFVPNLDSGGRYDPLTDTWTPTDLADAPFPRHDHAAVWTGSEMIVWGGCVDADCSDFRNNGGRYDPVTDAWTPTGTTGGPGGRAQHSAVWTGSEMIVWGGCRGGECAVELLTGGRYAANTNSWVPTSTETSPARRLDHTSVWTGSELVIWGGQSASGFRDGKRYDPATDAWTEVNRIGSMQRTRHTAVWTGSEMIVWSGTVFGQGTSPGGDRYDPLTDTWTAMTFTGAPAGRTEHAAVWTGTDMIVWGGTATAAFDTGGRYDPVADSWVATTTVNAPAARFGHTAVWSGSEMIVWGGRPDFLTEFDTGGRYDPVADNWSPVETTGAPGARADHTTVWTGTEMIVWGGENSGIPLGGGVRYHAATDSWSPVSAASAPGPRTAHAAVWTGTEMIVWGGDDGGVLLTGGRYDPAGNAWLSTSTGPYTPAARAGHTATWIDSQMFVFGGSWSQTKPGAAYCAKATDAPTLDIPAISTWGMSVITLSVLTLGTIFFRRCRSHEGKGGCWLIGRES